MNLLELAIVGILGLYAIEALPQNETIPPHPDPTQAEVQRARSYCWQYVNQMRVLYFAIKNDGLEQTIAKHPPEEEGSSLERAQKLGTEIEAVIKAETNPSDWLDSQWNSCLKNPENVRR